MSAFLIYLESVKIIRVVIREAFIVISFEVRFTSFVLSIQDFIGGDDGVIDVFLGVLAFGGYGEGGPHVDETSVWGGIGFDGVVEAADTDSREFLTEDWLVKSTPRYLNSICTSFRPLHNFFMPYPFDHFTNEFY